MLSHKALGLHLYKGGLYFTKTHSNSCKMAFSVINISTMLSLVALMLVQSTEATKIDCSLVLCAKPLCANPVTPKGECCPSCENSNCKFEGCVNYLPGGGVQWAPSPCTFCRCDVESNQQFCAIIDCFPLTEKDCFGYPVITRPNECCPSCDFGVPENRCRLVPQIFGRENITVSSDRGRTCSEEVIKKGCDKFGFRSSSGKRFRCTPKEGKRLLRFDENCPLCRATYTDNVRCRPVRDDSIIVGCDFVV